MSSFACAFTPASPPFATTPSSPTVPLRIPLNSPLFRAPSVAISFRENSLAVPLTDSFLKSANCAEPRKWPCRAAISKSWRVIPLGVTSTGEDSAILRMARSLDAYARSRPFSLPSSRYSNGELCTPTNATFPCDSSGKLNNLFNSFTGVLAEISSDARGELRSCTEPFNSTLVSPLDKLACTSWTAFFSSAAFTSKSNAKGAFTSGEMACSWRDENSPTQRGPAASYPKEARR